MVPDFLNDEYTGLLTELDSSAPTLTVSSGVLIPSAFISPAITMVTLALILATVMAHWNTSQIEFFPEKGGDRQKCLAEGRSAGVRSEALCISVYRNVGETI